MTISKSIFAVLLISVFALTVPTTASATWFISSSGILSNISNSILGDETEAPEVAETPHPEENKQAEQLKEQTQKQVEQKREEAKQKMEKTREVKKQLLENKGQSSEFELESEDASPGAKKGHSTLKIREQIVNEDGTIAEVTDKELENEDQVEITTPNGEVVTVSAKAAKRLQIMKDGIKAGTKMPISVNDQNELILTKIDGTTRVLTVLPNEAIGRLKGSGVLTDVPVGAAQPEIVEENGLPIYKIEGEKQEKIFGLFRINLKRQVNVSAETGEVISTQESSLTKFLDLFSF